MGKFRFVFILMCVLALCIPSCTSHADNQEELETKISTGSRSAIQISEEHRQIVEVAKHIKFDTDTFYLDITLEEAKGKSVAEKIYNMWLERLKIYTQEAREVISKGGHFTYVNTYTQYENNISRYSNISRDKNISRYNNVSGYSFRQDTFSTNGYVIYPNRNQCKIAFKDPLEAQFYKAIICSFMAELHNEKDPLGVVLTSTVEHRITLEGYKIRPYGVVEKVYEHMIVSGDVGPATSIPIPFPGDLGPNVKPHTLTYIAESYFPDKDYKLTASCDFMSIPLY